MTPAEPVRDEDLWFEDGSLIIQAENKLFRVSGDTLASKSSVFQHMLSFPQPDHYEKMEGCPLVHLSDSASEVTCFFKAIFKDGYFKAPPEPTNLETLLAVLRLGHKYDVQPLRQIALRHVGSAYPTSLRAWDSSYSTRTFPRVRNFDDEFQLLQVALETNARWVMPTLFYSCGAHPMQVILESPAWRRAGDLLIEKNLFLRGYVGQFAATLQVLKFLVEPTIKGCTSATSSTPFRCYTNRLQWFGTVETWRASIPLEIWDQCDWGRFQNDVCAVCLEKSRRAHRKARLEVWENLPKTYGLPPWHVLEAQKKQALE